MIIPTYKIEAFRVAIVEEDIIEKFESEEGLDLEGFEIFCTGFMYALADNEEDCANAKKQAEFLIDGFYFTDFDSENGDEK